MELPKELGNTPIKRIVAVYSKKFKDVYGFAPKIMNWGQLGVMFKKLLQFYSEQQIALLISLHFDWNGADGQDQFAHRRLQNACFPLEWVPRNANAYEAYLRNTLDINLDNPKVVELQVNKIIK